MRGFFDSMSHQWTMRFIQHRVADKRIHRLIQKWLKAGVSEDGEWSETTIGTPQGAVVTPALTKGESLCHPAGSSFHTLVASSQGGASIPGAALCRHPSEVRAVCVMWRATSDAVIPLVRIRVGGARQLASLPRHRL